MGEMQAGQLEARKARAKQWFESLRDDICAAFETLEAEAPAALYAGGAARFVRTPWSRSRMYWSRPVTLKPRSLISFTNSGFTP